jgi:hypothetical protein
MALVNHFFSQFTFTPFIRTLNIRIHISSYSLRFWVAQFGLADGDVDACPNSLPAQR